MAAAPQIVANDLGGAIGVYRQRETELVNDQCLVCEKCSGFLLAVLVLLGIGIGGAVMWARAADSLRTGKILAGIGFGGGILLTLIGRAMVRLEERRLNLPARETALRAEAAPLADQLAAAPPQPGRYRRALPYSLVRPTANGTRSWW
jgi:hypothetical protein